MGHRQTKKQLEKIRQLIRQEIAPNPSQTKLDWKSWTGLAIGALALILAIIELRPTLTASYSPPTDPARLLSSRFTITNDGYLPLNGVHAICYIEKTHSPYTYSNMARGVSPYNATLDPSDALTVPCDSDVHIIQNPVQDADLAIVVAYRSWPFTFIRHRKFFRFVSRRNGQTITWDRQPVSVLEDNFNRMVASNPAGLSMFK
jgi:hypothetical protein